MKATGIVRRVDDLGRIVIPKEIRRTLRIREGDPLLTTLTSFDLFFKGILDLADRITGLHPVSKTKPGSAQGRTGHLLFDYPAFIRRV